jgi:phage portal protein BeeE
MSFLTRLLTKEKPAQAQESKRSSTNNFQQQNTAVGRLAFEQLRKLNESFGGGNADFDIKQAAAKISIVNSCLRLIVNKISACELEIVKFDGKKTVVLTDHYLYNQLRYQPSTIFSNRNWIGNLVTVESIYGNSYFEINDGSFDPIESTLIDRAIIKDGKIFYQSSKDKDINYRQDEILHFKSFGEGIFGLSRLESVAWRFRSM